MKSISLSCASCGSNLEVTADIDRFACGYCGASQVVQRVGGTISLKLVTDAIRLVQAGTDRTAAELALKRLNDELQDLEQEFHSLRMQRQVQIQTNGKIFGWTLVGGFIFCAILAAPGGGSAYLALFLGIVGAVSILYIWSKQNSATKAKFDREEQPLFGLGNDIRRKIEENRKLVD